MEFLIGTAGQEPKPECLCRTLGEIGQGRMSLEADPIWRAVAQTGIASLRVALSPGEESPRQGQHVVGSSVESSDVFEAMESTTARAVGWFAEVL